MKFSSETTPTLIVGPPGSGKTEYLLKVARERLAQGKRVWWVGLPGQREQVLRRLTKSATLGFEFLNTQQLYYRLLADQPHALLARIPRLAVVAAALCEDLGGLPNPGEVKLYARAIAELKRHGLAPEDSPQTNPESESLARVYRLYEELKGELRDYDDYRKATLSALVEGKQLNIEADSIIFDGSRELSPYELAAIKPLSQLCELFVALPQAPRDFRPQVELKPRPNKLSCYRATNPIGEIRWVLRSVKQDLANGFEPLDIAIITPPGGNSELGALAADYGIPLRDETPRSLAQSLSARLLKQLLGLAERLEPAKLLPLPRFAQLARIAQDRGISGDEAITKLAAEQQLGAALAELLAEVRVTTDAYSWAKQILARLEQLHRLAPHYEELLADLRRHRENLLACAREAAKISQGQDFIDWWWSLIGSHPSYEAPPAGVAIVTPQLASGRRWRKAYLLRALSGGYSGRRGEDYFIPEEERSETVVLASLPRRYRGQDEQLHAELRQRADELVITYPAADRSGPLTPEARLLTNARELPLLPAGSPSELGQGGSFSPANAGASQFALSGLEDLRRYAECSFRWWSRKLLAAGERPWWLELLSELKKEERLSPERLALLQKDFPQASEWLARHQEKLLTLKYRVPLGPRDGIQAVVDAAETQGACAVLYHFTSPAALDRDKAAAIINQRWSEQLAAKEVLEHYRQRYRELQLVVWPLNHEPVAAFDKGITYVWKRFINRAEAAEQAQRQHGQGLVQPQPGFHCRNCEYGDFCREGN